MEMEQEMKSKKRAAKAKKPVEKQVRKVATTKDGKRYEVVGMDGKYLYCAGGVQFLHASGYVVQIADEETESEPTEVTDDGD